VKPAQKKQAGQQRRAAARRSKLVMWAVVIGIVGVIGYGLSQMSNVAFTDRDLPAVDFTDLTADQKNAALVEANTARCPCGCGMTLAQCVSTDATCPLRMTNVDKIRAMVTKARTSASD
jgi:hypothetical protein